MVVGLRDLCAGAEPTLRGAPVHKKGVNKYAGYVAGGKVGWYSKNSFPASIPSSLSKALVKAANNSLASSTWMSYGSIHKHLKGCQDYTGKRLQFPFTHESVLTLLGYLFGQTTLKSATINNLMSALRTAHISKGYYLHVLRPDIVSSLLKGRANRDACLARRKVERLPVTVDILNMLGLILELNTQLSRPYKLLVWAVSVIAFWGSFRIGELLSKRARTIDPETDLLKKDVMLVSRKVSGKNKEILQVSLKSPKEARGNSVPVVVEVFQTGDSLCPVKAYKDYSEAVGVKKLNSAAFRVPICGEAYRHQRFNADLKMLLGPHIKYGRILGHSFRAGLASLMAKKGFSQDEIKGIGRWTSEAFMKYIKSGRLLRFRFSEKLVKAVREEMKG